MPEPKSTSMGDKLSGNWYLTNAIWENSMGSYQPETGVRRFENGEIVPDTFRLIEHGWRDFDAANEVILRALEKGWPCWRIADFMVRLKDRRRTSPTIPTEAP